MEYGTGAGVRVPPTQHMNPSSFLRVYALCVCALTGLSVLLIAAVPLWQHAMQSAHALEQHDVYQFVTTGRVPCQGCDDSHITTLQSATLPATIAPYQSVLSADSLPASPDRHWLPAWLTSLLRLAFALVGLLIFAVHWRLYRNLGFAHG